MPGNKVKGRSPAVSDSPTPESRGQSTRLSSPWAVRVAAALIVLLGGLAYSNSFSTPFVFDDGGSIAENSTIRRLWPISRVLRPPPGETVGGRPLVNVSLAVNYALGGMDVRGYHGVNFGIHLLAAFTLLGVVRRTLLQPCLRERLGQVALPLSLAAVLLWTVHPLQTESVTYIVQRAEALAALFYLLTLYCVVRGADSLRPRLWHIAAVSACAAGMASKETVVSAPLIVLLYDRTFLAGTFRGALRRRWPLHLSLAATWLLLGCLVASTGNRGNSAGFGAGVGWGAYALTQFGAIVRYLRLAVWPSPLVLDYGVTLSHGAGQIVPYATLVALLLAATARAVWRWPAAGFLGTSFFALLAPTSSFVPVATQTMAEHRMYLPLAAVLVLAVAGAYVAAGRWLSRFRSVRPRWLGLWAGPVALLGAVAAALTFGTFQRNKDYRSELAIWQDTVRKWPQNSRAHTALGTALVADGRAVEALSSFAQALRLKPNDSDIHTNFGIALFAAGRQTEGLWHIQRALQLDPASAAAHNNMGNALAALRRTSEAVGQYQRALQLKPQHATAWNNLGSALDGLGRVSEAVGAFQQAIQLNPDFQMAQKNLGSALARLGRIDEAVRHYEFAVALQPDDAKAHYGLADALVAAGEPAQAYRHLEKAHDLAMARGDSKLAGEIGARLTSQRRRPLRR